MCGRNNKRQQIIIIIIKKKKIKAESYVLDWIENAQISFSPFINYILIFSGVNCKILLKESHV